MATLSLIASAAAVIALGTFGVGTFGYIAYREVADLVK